MPTIGLVHTVRRVIEPLSALADELLPQARQLHYLDESTLQDAVAAGGLTPDIIRRVCTLIGLAAERSDLVLVTCSSIGACAELAAPNCRVPVLRIDRPMAEEAVAKGSRIGVIATLQSTLEPTASLVETCAREAGCEVEVRRLLVEGAFAAAGCGDRATHDRLVREGLLRLLQPPSRAEVIVLAQASMAAVTEGLPPEIGAPILSSPRSGLLRAAEMLAGRRER